MMSMKHRSFCKSAPRSMCLTRSRPARHVCSVNPRRIVVAVDDTMDSLHAVNYTLSDLYREGDTVHLLHVIPKSRVKFPGTASFLCSTDSLDLEDQLEEHASSFINNSLVRAVRSHKAPCVIDVVRGRNIGETIVSKSDELEASLVVVTGHHKGALEEFFNGSVSKHVAQHCQRPTLIFQPPRLRPVTSPMASVMEEEEEESHPRVVRML